MKRFGWLIAIGVIVLVVAIIGLSLSGTYNSLVKKSQAVDGQWAQVETQYQRRYDLIPRLVESAKGIMNQEKAVFDSIAQARTKYGQAATSDAKAAAAGELDSAVSRLLVIVENYPDLKSDKAVIALMDELAGTENRISVERRRYNDLVLDYNTTIKTFPTNLIAGTFGFSEKQYFKSATGADQAPEVKF